ncbi:polyketide synthase dehydratase domain-containing protein, partial [Kitasatospora sp. NPDC090091]|uniref:polyketide synthase dehydratase domain-containing protein n=1 Tax=Kitasatospora sp. NPDC090091 TaxID=3364081 RepID=UPI0037F56ECE
TLRRNEPGPTRFLTSLAQAHTHGTTPTWTTLSLQPHTDHLALPTYAFQQQRYWLDSAASGAGDPAGLGLVPADHPLLGATIALAEGEGVVFTGRVSVRTQPWLADHVVFGTVLLPGTAYVELATRVGAEFGCGRVEELVLETPLLIPEQGAVQLQVTVGGIDDTGRRSLAVHSRIEPAVPDIGSAEGAWDRHAVGVLVPDPVASSEPDGSGLSVWPPEGAESVDVSGLYDGLAEVGYGYGPVFQGLQAAWRLGGDVFAEVALAEDDHAAAARFGLHPALLDAALHALGLVEGAGRDGVGLPFSWSGVSLHATGATALRVRLSPAGEDTVSLTVADPDGQPVASVDSLVTRPFSAQQLAGARAAGNSPLFGLEWSAVPVADTALVEPGRWAVLERAGTGKASAVLDVAGSLRGAGVTVESYADLAALDAAVDSGVPVPAVVVVPFVSAVPAGLTSPDEVAQVNSSARQRTVDALGLLQSWLGDERYAASRLVLLTHHAIATHPDENITDLPHTPLWGLTRSAQSEHPHRITLIDTDNHPTSWHTLPTTLTTHPQHALRNGTPHTPHLTHHTNTTPQPPINPNGTILITGGTGTLATHIARHLVTHHGARHLTLVSRSGPNAPHATELHTELTTLGATVTITACDTTDPKALHR